MASYSFPSPGYVNIPPYYNPASNTYPAFNLQYSLPDSKSDLSLFRFLHRLFQLIQQREMHQVVP